MVEARLAEHGDKVYRFLHACLPGFTGPLHTLSKALGYATWGGKRVRGALVMESCALCDLPERVALHPAAAIEAVHAYSLVHDDLPAMDDDDMRRGQPTLHRKYGEALAILAGDALQAKAFHILALTPEVDPARVMLLSGHLGHAAGAEGMVGGQYLDMVAETEPHPKHWSEAERIAEVTYVQQKKTGALIRWACLSGPMLAGRQTAPFETYADAIGLAFQIRDDLLDVEGSAEETGKAVGKDAGRGKVTFVDLLGVEGARARALALVDEAVAALDGFDTRADFLRDLARFIVTRRS